MCPYDVGLYLVVLAIHVTTFFCLVPDVDIPQVTFLFHLETPPPVVVFIDFTVNSNSSFTGKRLFVEKPGSAFQLE